MDGLYSLRFRPTDEWDGEFDVVIKGQELIWPVLTIDREADGCLTLSGMTDGSRVIWGEEFWYVVQVEPGAPSVSYYGDQVCWRTDHAA
ncbi:hypothetical protein [Brevundimonas sp.]|uniref:hypothetical protein n=1 Tax=Brevundimonas sp. TaxID=1871086 RepID=UPI003D6CF94C